MLCPSMHCNAVPLACYGASTELDQAIDPDRRHLSPAGLSVSIPPFAPTACQPVTQPHITPPLTPVGSPFHGQSGCLAPRPSQPLGQMRTTAKLLEPHSLAQLGSWLQAPLTSASCPPRLRPCQTRHPPRRRCWRSAPGSCCCRTCPGFSTPCTTSNAPLVGTID